MRVLIDTNSLESPELRVFLNAGPDNIAVLPEHTTAEIFKPRTLDAVFANHAILCAFPKQILVLHTNLHAIKVDARAPAITNRFIDLRTTKAFPAFCTMLDEARDGDIGYRLQLRKRQKWAAERANAVENAMGDLSETLAQVREHFTAHQLRLIGAGKTIPPEARQMILDISTAVAEDMARNGPGRAPVPPPPHRYNHFGWRWSLCDVINIIRLIGDGAQRRASDKSRNDHFDNVFAAFGTYFNGVMTDDKRLLAAQAIARLILRSLGARLGTDYIESGYILTLINEAD